MGESGIVDQIIGDSLLDFNKKFNKIGGKKVSKVRSLSFSTLICSCSESRNSSMQTTLERRMPQSAL